MKILIINTLYPPSCIGGAEISVKLLAEELAKKGTDVVVAAITKNNRRITAINNVKVYNVPLLNIYWPFKNKKKNELKRVLWHLIDTINFLMTYQLVKIIRYEKPDLIHTNNLAGFSVFVWIIARALRIPTIHTLRDYYLLCHLSTMHRHSKNCQSQCLSCKLLGIVKKKLSALPSSIVGISHYILKRHLELDYFNKSAHSCVIPNGIDIISERSAKQFEEKIKLGYIGRISQEKGIENLLHYLRENRFVTFKFYIAGRGNEKYVKMLKNEFGACAHFCGFIDPSIFFKKINVLIVPSKWNEPFGRIIVESYKYGVPVIGTNKGGIPELIKHGKTGYIYDPDDEKSLSFFLNRLLSNPDVIKMMRQECFKQAKKFSSSLLAKKYINLYTRTCKTYNE